MSEPTKRERAAELFRSLIRTAAGYGLHAGDDARIVEAVGLIIDSAKDEILAQLRDEAVDREKLEAEPIATRKGYRDRAEAAEAVAGPPKVACYRCRELCPCPDVWFVCHRCGLHQSKPPLRVEPEAEDPGHCPHCGEPFELIRPGKSQPTCECFGRDIG